MHHNHRKVSRKDTTLVYMKSMWQGFLSMVQTRLCWPVCLTKRHLLLIVLIRSFKSTVKMHIEGSSESKPGILVKG